MSDIEKLIEKLNEGVVHYYKTPLINIVGTKKLMKEAAEKIESLQAEIDTLKLTNEEILQETKDALVRMQGKIDALKSARSTYNSQPTHKPLTNEEIEKILVEIPDWDDYEYTLSFARAIEEKVVENFNAIPKPHLLSTKVIADTWNKHAVKNELYQIVIDNFARDIEAKVRSQYES